MCHYAILRASLRLANRYCNINDHYDTSNCSLATNETLWHDMTKKIDTVIKFVGTINGLYCAVRGIIMTDAVTIECNN